MVDETTITPPLRKERTLGTFEEELAKMKLRWKSLTPFPEGEVIVLGMGTTRKLCPFDAETWSVNNGYTQIFMMDGHCEKIFMAHGQTKDRGGNELFLWEHFNRLADEGIEIWNIHKVKGLKSKLFPLKRLIKKYGTDYFSDTLAYMIVWAIDKGYKKIRLYGCDMMTQEEYGWEKGGLEYWIGYARGLGIKVEICEGSQLLKTITGKPYGIKYWKMKDIDPFRLLRRKKNPPSDSEIMEVTRSSQSSTPPSGLTPWVTM